MHAPFASHWNTAATMRSSAVLCTASLLITTVTLPVMAAMSYWQGDVTDGRWSNGNNWTGSVPGVDDAAIFKSVDFTGIYQPTLWSEDGYGFCKRLRVAAVGRNVVITINGPGGRLNLDMNPNLNNESIDMGDADSNLTIKGDGTAGNTFAQRNNAGDDVMWDVTGGGDLTISPHTFIIQNNVNLTINVGANRTVDIQTSTSANSAQIIKNGAGLLILGANNGHTDGTVVNAGTIRMGSDGALGDAAGSFTITGGTLDMNGYSSTLGDLFMDGGDIVNIGELHAGMLGLGDGDAQFALATNSIVTFADSRTAEWGAGTLTFSGSLDYGQVRVGTNALALTGAQLTALDYEGQHILIDHEGYLRPPRPGTVLVVR